MLGVLKLFLALCLVPVVIAVTQGFSGELARITDLREFFLIGLVAYTLWHLFVFSFARLFDFCQKGFSELFRFSVLLQQLVPRVLPLGPSLLLLLYYVSTQFFQLRGAEQVVFFLTGFCLAAHVILVAQEMVAEDDQVVKGHYLFSLTCVYIVNLLVVALLLHLNLPKFSTWHFLETSQDSAAKIYQFLIHRFVI